MTIEIIKEEDLSDGVGRHFYEITCNTVEEALEFAHEVHHTSYDEAIVRSLIDYRYYDYQDDYYFGLEIRLIEADDDEEIEGDANTAKLSVYDKDGRFTITLADVLGRTQGPRDSIESIVKDITKLYIPPFEHIDAYKRAIYDLAGQQQLRRMIGNFHPTAEFETRERFEMIVEFLDDVVRGYND